MTPENSKKLRKKATIVSYQWPDEKETGIVKSSVGLSRGEARILKTGNPEESNSIRTRNIRNEQKENPEMGEISKVIIMLLISSPKYERWYEVAQCELKADVDVFLFRKTRRKFCCNKNWKARPNADKFSFATCQNPK